MTLAELSKGQTAYIRDLSQLAPDVRKKLLVMGVLPNTPITLTRRAPLGDPIQFEVRGVSLALRNKIAESISVDMTNQNTKVGA